MSVKCKQARKPEFDLRNHVRKKNTTRVEGGYGRTGKCGGSRYMM